MFYKNLDYFKTYLKNIRISQIISFIHKLFVSSILQEYKLETVYSAMPYWFNDNLEYNQSKI